MKVLGQCEVVYEEIAGVIVSKETVQFRRVFLFACRKFSSGFGGFSLLEKEPGTSDV